jgi:hypothetical protein
LSMARRILGRALSALSGTLCEISGYLRHPR